MFGRQRIMEGAMVESEMKGSDWNEAQEKLRFLNINMLPSNAGVTVS